MDLIGSINFIENRLGGRKSARARGSRHKKIPAMMKQPKRVLSPMTIIPQASTTRGSGASWIRPPSLDAMYEIVSACTHLRRAIAGCFQAASQGRTAFSVHAHRRCASC